MNTQKLLDLIKVNEQTEQFNMGIWVHDCGTYGCLYGNYNISKGKIKFNKGMYEPSIHIKISEEFDITIKESYFLFAAINPIATNIGKCFHYHSGEPRNLTDKNAALNRVRKFIYYKLHKQEMCYDENGVRESARHTEGDHMVLPQISAKIKGAFSAEKQGC